MPMLDLLADVAKTLVPPPDSDHNANLRWRWSVAIVSSVSLIGVIGISMAAFGLAPGFDGFAKAADLKQSVAEQRIHWTFDADSRLLDLRIKHCEAKTPEAKQLYWGKISELLIRYQQLSGRTYNLPSCADL